MKKVTFVVALVLLASQALAGQVINEVKEPQFLMAFSAESGTLNGETLTLKNPSLVIYFADRPARIAGHMDIADFAALWTSGDSNSFEVDPPNAVISTLGAPEEARAVVELSNPSHGEGHISFTVRIIEGELPAEWLACSLFVDPALCVPCI